MLLLLLYYYYTFPVPMLAASDLSQALTLIIASFGFYSNLFITFDRSNWRRIIKRRYGWNPSESAITATTMNE